MSAVPTISIRALEPEDLEFLYMIENEPKLWTVGNSNVPYSRYVLHEYIASSANDIYKDGQVRLMIVDGAGHNVGVVDLINFEPKHRRAEVGIVVASAYRGQGYAQEALRMLTRYARQILRLHQLYALVSVSNENSLRLFTAAGFERTARLADWLWEAEKYVDAYVMQLFIKKS